MDGTAGLSRSLSSEVCEPSSAEDCYVAPRLRGLSIEAAALRWTPPPLPSTP